MNDENEPAVRVTMSTMYKELQRVAKVSDDTATEIRRILDELAAHDTQIRWMKERMGWAVGALMTVAAVMPWIRDLVLL
jgi:cell division protein FtsX